jgi:hypothetical protein
MVCPTADQFSATPNVKTVGLQRLLAIVSGGPDVLNSPNPIEWPYVPGTVRCDSCFAKICDLQFQGIEQCSLRPDGLLPGILSKGGSTGAYLSPGQPHHMGEKELQIEHL